jgi:hypothetical protein
LKQQLDKEYKSDVGVQTDPEVKIGENLEQFASTLTHVMKPQAKGYMKKLNRVIKKKDEPKTKKMTMIDKYRKQELPSSQAERKAA